MKTLNEFNCPQFLSSTYIMWSCILFIWLSVPSILKLLLSFLPIIQFSVMPNLFFSVSIVTCKTLYFIYFIVSYQLAQSFLLLEIISLSIIFLSFNSRVLFYYASGLFSRRQFFLKPIRDIKQFYKFYNASHNKQFSSRTLPFAIVIF